jgi:phosphatidylinositol alpha-1,6-mannosyltransferase
MPRKGLAEFVANSLPLLVADDQEWLLLIAGSEPVNALNRHKESVLDRIHDAVATHNLEEQVRLLGHVDDDLLASLYTAADVFVFPLIESPGDVEGFGMVAIEAAAHGTPTVAFDCGGVGDAVVDGTNGALVTGGDYGRFAEAVREVAAADLRQTSNEFAQKFSWLHYNRQIEDCLNDTAK